MYNKSVRQPFFKPESNFDRAFELSILLKAIDGVLETIGGLILLAFRPETLHGLAITLTQHELDRDPRDLLANHLLHATNGLTRGAIVFGAIYLLAHGLAKVVLVFEILRGHLWAYKGLIIFIAVFMWYQIYRVGYSHSIGLTALTVFDAIVVYLTAKEYQKQRLAAEV